MKTASESQIKELLAIVKRTSDEQAKVDKLITERNVVGSNKSRLEGTRIFFLGVNFNRSLSN